MTGDYIEVDGVPHLTGKQLAEQRGVVTSTVNRWVRIGLFPNAKKLPIANGTWVIPLSDIEKATFRESGSPRLMKAGKAGAAFREQMKTLIGGAEVGEILTVTFDVIRKATAKGHLRLAAKAVGRSVRFQESDEDRLTFKVKGGGNESAHTTTLVSKGDNGHATVDGADSGERQTVREPAVDAA